MSERGWLAYVKEHTKELGAREQQYLAQALEAVSVLKAANPQLSDDAAIKAAIELVSQTGHRRAIEHNTEALYSAKEKDND